MPLKNPSKLHYISLCKLKNSSCIIRPTISCFLRNKIVEAIKIQRLGQKKIQNSKLQKWPSLSPPSPSLSLSLLPCMSPTLSLIRFLALLGLPGFSLFLWSISMEPSRLIVQSEEAHDADTKNVYSVWAIPPDDVRERLKKLMDGLRLEFGGPQFNPHVTVVGAISLTEIDAVQKFRSACDGLKAYSASVEKVDSGTFFYQCVYLLLHPTAEIVEASAHCTGHFGYKSLTPYMPHLSLLYGDLTDEEKKRAREKANILDESISSLKFEVTRLALYKTDTQDKTCQSWEKVAECSLSTN